MYNKRFDLFIKMKFITIAEASYNTQSSGTPLLHIYIYI